MFEIRFMIRDWRHAIRYLQYAMLLCAVLLLAACRPDAPQADGFAIVAVDPQSGDVAVAAAACSQNPLDYRAALVPRLGAAVQLGIASPLQRDRMNAGIAQPLPAPELVSSLSQTTSDPGIETRQYAVVTLQDGVPQASIYLGKEISEFEDGSVGAAGNVAVVGGGMANADVAARTLAAFEQTTPGALTLSDRLMRALEAGSAAGGLAACNRNGVEQTASTAFLMLARKGDPPFRVNTLGNTAEEESDTPYLALSDTEPPGGWNAIRAVREQYADWRESNLAPCAECSQVQVTLPEGGVAERSPFAVLIQNALEFVAGFVVLVMGLTMVFFALRPRLRRAGHSGEN